MTKVEEYFNGLITLDELIYYLVSEIEKRSVEELCKGKENNK